MKPLHALVASLWIATAIIARAQEPGSPDVYVSPSFDHRLTFAPGDPGLARLVASGAATRVEDYGAFIVAVVDERLAGGRDALSSIGGELRDDFAVVGLNGFELDTADADGLAAKLASIPDFLRLEELEAAPAGDRLWLVQFAGPIRDAWLESLRATGALIVSPMATHAYVELVPAKSFRTFAAFRRDPSGQWIGA
jgi:hypothetical protein